MRLPHGISVSRRVKPMLLTLIVVQATLYGRDADITRRSVRCDLLHELHSSVIVFTPLLLLGGDSEFNGNILGYLSRALRCQIRVHVTRLHLVLHDVADRQPLFNIGRAPLFWLPRCREARIGRSPLAENFYDVLAILM